MDYKRVTIFSGHYGSGKTNIAVNYAKLLKKSEPRITIADLDIVNPYFRTRDSAQVLASVGIKLISSEYAGSNVDLPSLPQELFAITDDTDGHYILDVGGDDRGALALGRLVPHLIKEENYEMVFVINCYRPLSSNPADTIEIMHEIEQACHMPFTAIANNSNLGGETTAEDVLFSIPYAQKISELSGLPIKMTCVNESLAAEPALKDLNPFSLQLQDKSSWS